MTNSCRGTRVLTAGGRIVKALIIIPPADGADPELIGRILRVDKAVLEQGQIEGHVEAAMIISPLLLVHGMDLEPIGKILRLDKAVQEQVLVEDHAEAAMVAILPVHGADPGPIGRILRTDKAVLEPALI